MCRASDSSRPPVNQPVRPACVETPQWNRASGDAILLPAALMFLVLLNAFFLVDSAAASQIPGESRAGVLYAITHLHPIVYAILFIIVGLSVANLVYQGYLARGRNAVASLLHGDAATRREEDSSEESTVRPDSPQRSVANGASRRIASEESRPAQERVTGAARVVKRAGASTLRQPTPLDGVNHTLPTLAPRGGNGQAGADRGSEKAAAGPEFRFTSAVEVPPPDEIQRRDREQLVVSGAVRGADGKGLGSVIVYLADEQGNRVGQSCRSLPDTGEFKVQVNSPGKYTLHGYKRGFVAENPEAAVLPLEAGKIEGYSLLMVPQGCTLHGRVVTDPELGSPADLEVRCVREDGSTAGVTSPGSEGSFSIGAIPSDVVCRLEVHNAQGEVLYRSEPVETGTHRELRRDLTIPVAAPHGELRESTVDSASHDADDRGQVPDSPIPPLSGPTS